MTDDTTTTHQDRQKAIETLQELVRDIQVAMLTTILPDGSLRSRPMETARSRFDGDLWFFTEGDAPKCDEIAQHPQVNLSYAQPESDRFVSISGQAEIVRDRQRMELLWNPLFKQWFPQGLNDPQLALLRVKVEAAEYWDVPAGAMVRLGGFMRSLVTGQPPEGEHEKLRWPK